MSVKYFLPLVAAAALLAQQAAKPVVVVLLGPPASGKTTQADYLHRKYGVTVISMEELLAASKKPLARGDAAVGELLRQQLTSLDAHNGFVIDGYPATRAQAEHLGKLVKELKLPSPVVIEIRIPDELARDRSAKRGSPEDKPDLVERRLAEYHRESKIIREYYAENDVWTVDGTRDPTGVSATIRTLIENR